MKHDFYGQVTFKEIYNRIIPLLCDLIDNQYS